MTIETTFIDAEALEVRDAGNRHELEGICVPYGIASDKAIAGRPEMFHPGAFATAVEKAGKIRLVDANHEYQTRRPVGVAAQLEDRSAGLFGRFRFYDTPEGRAAYENVREGTYGGLSVGFVAVRERNIAGRREILEARLHHVSLVDEPAYDEAQVLQLRNATAGYEHLRTRPAIEVDLDDDDTPMLVRVRRMLGNVRA